MMFYLFSSRAHSSWAFDVCLKSLFIVGTRKRIFLGMVNYHFLIKNQWYKNYRQPYLLFEHYYQKPSLCGRVSLSKKVTSTLGKFHRRPPLNRISKKNSTLPLCSSIATVDADACCVLLRITLRFRYITVGHFSQLPYLCDTKNFTFPRLRWISTFCWYGNGELFLN